MSAKKIKDAIQKLEPTQKLNRVRLLYQGPFGRILCEEASFFASKDGALVGTCKSFDEAIEILAREAQS
jgi:hypothetical protein